MSPIAVRRRRYQWSGRLVLGRDQSLFEHSLAVLGIQTSWFRGVHEIQECSDELFWRFDLGEVAHALDNHQSAPGNRITRSMRMADGDDVVPVAPDNQRRH